MKPARSLRMLLIAGAIATVRAEGFHNGPVTFGSGDQAHPGGAKSFTSITLGGTNNQTVNTQSIPKVTTLSAAAPLNANLIGSSLQQSRVIQTANPQISVFQAPSPQISYVQDGASQVGVLGGNLQVGLLQSRAPSVSYLQSSAPRFTISQVRPSVSVTGGPGFGYSSGGVYSINQRAPQITVAQSPNLQFRVPEQQIHVLQAPNPQLQILEAPTPQISVVQARAPQLQVVQSPAPQIRIQQAAAPQIRVQAQQPRISVSGPATSHGYTVNAPGLTKTATFGYPSGGVSITQSAPRVTVAQAPKLQVRVAQPQLQVYQAPAPQISIQQAPAPQIRIQQAPASQIRIQQAPAPQIRVQTQQPRISVSGPATSHGYSVNAPGLTKTATFGYPSGAVSITQSAPRVTVAQAPKLQVRVAQPQLQVYQAPAPQIRIQQTPAPQIRIQQAPAPQIRVQAQQPRISVSGPATSHGYTVNAPGLTKTATFGYPSGGVSITQSAPRVSVSQAAPRFQVRVPQQQVQVVQARAPQISVVQPSSPQISVYQAPAQQIRFSAPAPQIRVRAQQPSISVSGPATSHGYTVNAPGLTKTATFGYPSGGVSITQSSPRVTVSQAPAPRLQFRVPQQQIRVLQAQAPQIRIQQDPAPQIRIQQAPAPQIRLSAPAPQISVQAQQPRISLSGPATSHGYTVNASGLTKTATFGYPSGGVSITQSAPQVRVSQQTPLQLRIPQQQIRVAQAPAQQIRIQQQPQYQVIQAPAPQISVVQARAPQLQFLQAPASQIRIQQAEAPQIRIQQAAAPQIGVQTQQPRIAVSGPATSHGYTVNAPGLTKTASFGYPSGRVSIQQTAPRVTVTEQATPKVQVRVAQPQLQVLQSPAPQIRIQQAQSPQLHVIQAQPPQVHLVEAPAPQFHLVQAASPQYQVLQQAVQPTYTVAQPQISYVKSYQPDVHVVEAPAPRIEISQPQVKTIQVEAPKTITASVSGFSAPSVRQQAFNTPSHGYSVSAPGFTKHKTFAGPSVYGTHQSGGVSGASGIGNVDFSIRQPRKATAKAA